MLLAGRPPLHAHEASELLDICDALRVDEARWAMSVGVKVPDLPQVDLAIPIRTPDGYAALPYAPPPVVDDGTWGTEEDAWQPDGDDEGGGW